MSRTGPSGPGCAAPAWALFSARLEQLASPGVVQTLLQPHPDLALVGDLNLPIPKLRAANVLASMLEPRRRLDQALHAAILEAPERRLQVSAESHPPIDRPAGETCLSHPLESRHNTCVYLDASDLKGRLGKAHQVCSKAVVVAMGVNGNGRREWLASKVGDSETETSWRESSAQLKHPREPGLNGVRLVFSDAHTGLTKAIRRQLKGFVCQRCRGAFGSAAGPIVLATCCSAPPKLTMAWSRPPWAAWSPRKALRRSSHAGKVWPPRWRNASPRPRPHARGPAEHAGLDIASAAMA